MFCSLGTNVYVSAICGSLKIGEAEYNSENHDIEFVEQSSCEIHSDHFPVLFSFVVDITMRMFFENDNSPAGPPTKLVIDGKELLSLNGRSLSVKEKIVITEVSDNFPELFAEKLCEVSRFIWAPIRYEHTGITNTIDGILKDASKELDRQEKAGEPLAAQEIVGKITASTVRTKLRNSQMHDFYLEQKIVQHSDLIEFNVRLELLRMYPDICLLVNKNI